MERSFPGFTSESFAIFPELAQNNYKPWFDQNRERYERRVQGAFRGLLASLEPFLLKLNRHFETGGKTNGNFSRINRDIRFSKDKSPYKPNYYLYAFDGRHDRGHAGRLYVGLAAECLTVGFSIYATDKRGPKGALETVFRKRDVTYWHRIEKRDWAQHPGLPRRAEDWQTLQAWIVRKVFEPNARGLGSPAFGQQVERIFSELYPLYVFTSVASPKWQSELKRAA